MVPGSSAGRVTPSQLSPSSACCRASSNAACSARLNEPPTNALGFAALAAAITCSR